jgi:hypothetical protein
MLMTAVVTSVLLRPMQMPDAMVAPMTTQRWSGQMPIVGVAHLCDTFMA